MADETTIAPGEAPPPPLRDQNQDLRSEFVEAVEAAIQGDDVPGVTRLVSGLEPPDMADLIQVLDPDDRTALIRLLGDEFDFAALTELDEAQRVQIIEDLPSQTVAEGVRDLESDDAVYILEDLDEEDQEAILAQIPAPERVTLERGLDYPEGSAGRRMQTDFIAVPPFWSVGQTIDYMRAARDLPDDFYEVFVVDPGYRLVGTVSLNRLLRALRQVKIAEIMDETQHKVAAVDPQEEVARVFERYDLVSVPVVDPSDRLVGVITVDDIVDVIQEEADEDIKSLGGVRGEEFSAPMASIVRSRFNWLLVNLGTAFLASAVLGLFQVELEKMVALAVLAPIVASQGGNATTQTMTIVVRAIATRELTKGNTWRVLGREMVVGLINGLAFALITGIGAYLWFKTPDLGIVIALAIVVNMVAAALGGVLIPLALYRAGTDPAVSSGVFITTVTDVVGFFAFLGIATLWFGLR